MSTTEFVLLILAGCLPALTILWVKLPEWAYTRRLPNPAVGQIWVSQNNGDRIRISEVVVNATGLMVWSYQIESSIGFNPIPMTACGVDHWRQKLFTERRVLA